MDKKIPFKKLRKPQVSITHEMVTKATEEFIARGGKIKKLPFIDTEEPDMLSAVTGDISSIQFSVTVKGHAHYTVEGFQRNKQP